MFFFSELQELKVSDSSGRIAGKLLDICMDVGAGLPTSQSLVIYRFRRGRRETAAVPWDWVDSVTRESISLNRERDEVWESGMEAGGLLLGRHLLDRQIVDLHGNKVVRVNDLLLAESDSRLRLTDVDVSQRALLRRLGLERTAQRFVGMLGSGLPERTIPWTYVAPLEMHSPDVKLTVTQTQLAELHPTDIADIIEQVDPQHRERLLDILGAFTAAESLSEVDPGKMADVLEDITETRAADILEIMPPDEATDILALLPRDKAERLLNIMGVRESRVIRELLGYSEDTAGGRMTTEYLAVPSHYTASECIYFLRRNAPDAETVYYLYVLDDEGRLKGVISLRDLLTASPDARVEDFMRRDVISVNVEDDQEMVADVISRYNLLALPVVDDGNILKGIITVDDMIDVIREEAMEDLSHIGGLELAEAGAVPAFLGRLPSLLVTLLVGLASALLLLAFEGRFVSLIPLVFFMPLILRASQDIGIFSLAVMLEQIGGKDLQRREIMRMAGRELQVVLPFSVGFALVGGIIAGFWQGCARLGLTIGLTLFLSILAGAAVGVISPLVSKRLKGELRYTQTRFSSLFIAFASLAVYLGMATALLA